MAPVPDILTAIHDYTQAGPSWDRCMQRIGTIPLLDVPTEYQLAVLVSHGQAAAKRLAENPKAPNQRTLKRQIIASQEATRRLVFHNLRFAAWMARLSMGLHRLPDDQTFSQRFATGSSDRHERRTGADARRNRTAMLHRFADANMSIEDRFQVLVLGLYTAAEKYRPEGNAKFVTFAAYPMIQALSRAINCERYHDNLSKGTAESLTRVRMARRKLRRLTGYEPTARELAVDTDFGVMAIHYRLEEDALLPYYFLEDLDRYASGVDRDSFERLGLADKLYDEHMMDPADIVWLSRMDEGIETVLMTLSEREAGVIRLRFGLMNGHTSTLEQIGDVYGVSRERIRQIEKIAMNKLRHPSRSNTLRIYVGQDGYDNRSARKQRKPPPLTVATDPDRYDLESHPWLLRKMS